MGIKVFMNSFSLAFFFCLATHRHTLSMKSSWLVHSILHKSIRSVYCIISVHITQNVCRCHNTCKCPAGYVLLQLWPTGETNPFLANSSTLTTSSCMYTDVAIVTSSTATLIGTREHSMLTGIQVKIQKYIKNKTENGHMEHTRWSLCSAIESERTINMDTWNTQSEVCVQL